jgi:hypothetical protein
MEAVEKREILQWVPRTPQAGEQEKSKPDHGAGPQSAGTAPCPGASQPAVTPS